MIRVRVRWLYTCGLHVWSPYKNHKKGYYVDSFCFGGHFCHIENIIIVLEGWVAASAFVDAFFDLVAPGPLPFVGALVDPLVSLHSGGSCWLVLGLETGGACDGPPAHVVGAAGANPCGLLLVALEGWPWVCWGWCILCCLPRMMTVVV